ncbi:MAG TPA: DNA translocase FtsK 4TM domain-containing protein [Stellaceae bacterium]|nr:DNA translocase FtsK 4TM domain-containing protein [Stellaceae bacterium]
MANLTAGLDKTFAAAGLKEFVRRRLSEVCGALVFLVSLIAALVLATYDHGDPSLNHAVDKVPANFGGYPGAIAADLLLQTVGLGAVLLPLVLAVWGLRLLLNLTIGRLWLRLMLLPPLVVFGATALAILPAPAFFGLPTGMGGVLGMVMWRLIGFWGDISALVAAGIAAAGGLLLVYIMGLSRGDWLEVGRNAGRAASASRVGGAAIAVAGGKLGGATWRWGRKKAEALRREPMVAGAARAPREAPIKPRRATDPATRIEPSMNREPFVQRAPIDANSPMDGAGIEGVGPRDLPRGLVAPKNPGTAPGKRAEQARQPTLDLEPATDYALPPLDLLAEPPPPRPGASKTNALNEEALEQNARLLITVLEDFGVRGEIVKVRPGPVVTLYELEPAPGTKSSRIIGLADDIARSMSAVSVRVAVIPGRNVIGIELPNAKSETVYLRELLASEAYERTGAKLSLILGKDIGGAPIIADLAKMPHLLIAGTTGSGKSVGINTMILSILYRMPPDQCKFIMIDPKMLELSVYDGIPHLLSPVVTDPRKAVVALKWTVREMENRYRAMSKLGVRNIEGYNARLTEAAAKAEPLMRRVQTGFDTESGQPLFEDQPLDMTPLPFIVVVVDEMADLMLVAGKDIEAAIQRLAQMARAAGIHIIMATQRPSVDVITGTIKANFPTRISFQVTSKIDSRTILGESGAEQLLGRGDMLYMAGGGRITRVHGPFVADHEVESVVSFLKSQGEPIYIDEVTEEDDLAEAATASTGGKDDDADGSDQLYDQAVALVCRERKASTSFVQRHLQIGYNRAARIMDRLEHEGVVSSANHVGKREVLAPPNR